MKYKKGDKVRVLKSRYHYFESGDICEVKGITESLILLEANDINWPHNLYEIEPYQEKPEFIASKHEHGGVNITGEELRRIVDKLDEIEPYREEIKLEDGMCFSAEIEGVWCEGKVTIGADRIYLCQSLKDGENCEDKKGFKFSWTIMGGVDKNLIDCEVKNLKTWWGEAGIIKDCNVDLKEFNKTVINYIKQINSKDEVSKTNIKREGQRSTRKKLYSEEGKIARGVRPNCNRKATLRRRAGAKRSKVTGKRLQLD